jgi:hypothetical protein
MTGKSLQLFLALRSLVAFYVGLDVSTTVRLVRTEGGAALDLLAGGVYVRETVRCCRPLLCVCYLCANPFGVQEKSP